VDSKSAWVKCWGGQAQKERLIGGEKGEPNETLRYAGTIETGESFYINSRRHFSDMASAWTAAQAARLGVTGDTITAAIERGWLASEIDSVSQAADLEGKPPDRDVFGLKVVRG
jgi:hypothetical protein